MQIEIKTVMKSKAVYGWGFCIFHPIFFCKPKTAQKVIYKSRIENRN